MSQKPTNEFTDREKFLLSYYRDKELCTSHRNWMFDAAIAAASLFMFVAFLRNAEVSFVFVAYVLVLGRLYSLVSETGQWARDFQSIIGKYDRRIQELTEAAKAKGGAE